ncbi:competence type IV pilus minor pilin ComGD [Allobacillus sp. GCM10007491]|uniref:Type II secretion system protein n=1 Tax=Allobacillus saliphilus TaxID=2912308 RepID=A0A941CW01_9BACI|nr:type II secretion system protein [Allobacillus saliphilus]
MEVKASNQEGFTLIEILVVLSIILILSHFYLLAHSQKPTKQTMDQFLETFENDLFYLQQYTMTYQIIPQLFFDPSNHMYTIRHASLDQPLLERKYRKDIRIQLNNFKNPLTFTTRGNLSSPGTFFIHFGEQIYELKFPFGKGQFHVEKLEANVRPYHTVI